MKTRGMRNKIGRKGIASAIATGIVLVSLLSLLAVLHVGGIEFGPTGFVVLGDVGGTFFEGFESGSFATNGWTISCIGCTNNWSVRSDTPYAGTYHAGVTQTGANDPSYLEIDVSTTSYQNITVEYYRQRVGLDAADDFAVEWWNGTGWNVLEQLGGATANDPAYQFQSFSLPSAADDNSAFKLRFMCEVGAVSESCFVDNVNVSGTAGGDTTPPTITIVSPGNTTYTTSTVPLNVSANETTDTWWYNLNGAGNVTFIPNTTITGSEGSNDIVVYANDTAGNIGSATEYFTIDTTPPATITSLANQSAGSNWIYWNWTNPADADFSQAIVYIDGSNVANTSNNYYNATGLTSDTSYTITVHTKDTAGNVNNTDVNSTASTLQTPNNAPAVSNVILSSTSGNNLTTDNLTVTFDASDADGDPVKNITNWYLNSTSITVLNMPFEGGSNATYTKDYSGFGNDGTVNGAMWGSTGGYDGFGAYVFDGTNDYVNLSKSNSLSDLNTDLTVEAWVYSNNNTDQHLIFDNCEVWATEGYCLVILDNEFRFYVGLPGAPRAIASGIQTGRWYHVAGTYDNASIKIYVNGSLINTTAAVGPLNKPGDEDIVIGYNSAGGNYFDGVIDEVRIYNRALTAEQILTLYENKTDLIVSQETSIGDVWRADVTPNDGTEDGATMQSNTVTVGSDTIPPTITFVSPTPANGSAQAEDWVFVNVTLNETGSAALLEWNSVNESMSGSGTNFWLNKTGLANGNYSYKVWANDTSNNWGFSETRTVEIAPAVVSGTITDADGNPVNSTIQVYNETGDLIITDNENYDFKLVENKKYEILITPGSGAIKSLRLFNLSVSGDVNNIVQLDDVPENVSSKPLDIANWTEVAAFAPNASVSYGVAELNFSYGAGNLLALFKCGSWSFVIRNCTGNWTYLQDLTDGPNTFAVNLTAGDPAVGAARKPDFAESLKIYDVSGLDESGRVGGGLLQGTFYDGAALEFAPGRSYRIEVHVEQNASGAVGNLKDPYYKGIQTDWSIDNSGSDAPGLTAIYDPDGSTGFGYVVSMGIQAGKQKITWDGLLTGGGTVDGMDYGDIVKFWFVADIPDNATIESNSVQFFGYTIEASNNAKINNGFQTQEDTTPPVITIESPLNQTYAQNWVWANASLNEVGSWCGYSLDSAANVTMTNDSSSHFFANVSGLIESGHSIVFSCNDTLGNLGSTSIWFTYSREKFRLTVNLTNEVDQVILNSTLKLENETEQIENHTFESSTTSSYDFLLYPTNYDLQMEIPIQNDSVSVVIKDIAVTQNTTAPAQLISEGAYNGILPGGFVQMGYIFALDTSGFNFVNAIVVLPKGSVQIQKVFHCTSWDFASKNCSAWQPLAAFQSNSTHIWFNATDFDAYGGAGGCVENWACTDWGSCSGGIQTRTCTDLNDCGTEEDKPAESQSCSSGGGGGGGSIITTSQTTNETNISYQPTEGETLIIGPEGEIQGEIETPPPPSENETNGTLTGQILFVPPQIYPDPIWGMLALILMMILAAILLLRKSEISEKAKKMFSLIHVVLVVSIVFLLLLTFFERETLSTAGTTADVILSAGSAAVADPLLALIVGLSIAGAVLATMSKKIMGKLAHLEIGRHAAALHKARHEHRWRQTLEKDIEAIVKAIHHKKKK